MDMFVPYIAGFFDGEGTVDIRWRMAKAGNGKKYERFEVRVMLCQMVIKPLEMCRGRWGGSIQMQKVPRWIVTGQQAAKFLRDILPFLIVKKDEAEIAVEFAATMRDGVVNTAGSKGVDPISAEIREKRRALHEKIRRVRVEKGVTPRANRVSAPLAA